MELGMNRASDIKRRPRQPHGFQGQCLPWLGQGTEEDTPVPGHCRRHGWRYSETEKCPERSLRFSPREKQGESSPETRGGDQAGLTLEDLESG